MKKRYTTPTSETIELADKLCGLVAGSNELGGNRALGKGVMKNWDEVKEHSHRVQKQQTQNLLKTINTNLYKNNAHNY